MVVILVSPIVSITDPYNNENKNPIQEPNHEEELDILQNNCLLWALQKMSVLWGKEKQKDTSWLKKKQN